MSLERKVAVGDPLNISAKTYNELLDMLAHHKRNRNRVNAQRVFDSIKGTAQIVVRNSSGAARPSFSVLRISGVVGNVSNRPHDFNNRIAVDGFTPLSTDDTFCITQEPLAASSSGRNIGKAIATGYALCKVKIDDTDNLYANPASGVTTHLVAAESGQCRIVWYGATGVAEDATNNIYWAIVHIIGQTAASAGGSTSPVDSEEVFSISDVCPVFEEITYAEGIDELTTLLSLVTGFASGKVLGAVSGALQWVAQPEIPEPEPTPAPIPPGMVAPYAGTSVPGGWLLCNGQTVSRATYADLFAAIGTMYGVGDGSTTFAVPNLQRRVVVGSGGTGTATLGNAVGNTGGSETHALTTAELAAHTHNLVPGGVTVRVTDLSSGGTIGFTAGTRVNYDIAATQSAGSGTAHNNIQPSIVLNYLIKT